MKKEPKLKEILARNLRENRRKCGYTQEKLAELAGVSTHYLAMMEVGRHFATSDTLEKIAKALEIPVFELFLTEQSPRKELEQLRKDIKKDIMNDINKAISKAVKQSIEEMKKGD